MNWVDPPIMWLVRLGMCSSKDFLLHHALPRCFSSDTWNFSVVMMTAWIGYILWTRIKAVFLLYRHHDTHKTSNRFTLKINWNNLTCCLEIAQVNRRKECLKFNCMQPVLCWNISHAKRVGIAWQQNQRAKWISVPRLRLLMHHRHGHLKCIACIIHTETIGISIFTHRT